MEFNEEALRQLLEEDSRQTTRELAQSLGPFHSTVHNHLISMGKVCKLSQWLPHELDERQRRQRTDTATTLLSYRRTQTWLETIVTGDKKWCLYTNVKCRRSWEDGNSRPQLQATSGPCFLYDGIAWVFFIDNCYQITPPSHLSCTVSNSIAWLKKFNNFGRRIELSDSCMTMLDLTEQY